MNRRLGADAARFLSSRAAESPGGHSAGPADVVSAVSTYSARSVIEGSREAARRAGTRHATAATSNSTPTTPP